MRVSPVEGSSRERRKISYFLRGNPLQGGPSLPSSSETPLFSGGSSQTSFFPLSGESPFRVPGERKEVWPEREEGFLTSLEVILAKKRQASLPRAKSPCFLRFALKPHFFLFLEKVPSEYRERLRRFGERREEETPRKNASFPCRRSDWREKKEILLPWK